MSCPHGLHLHGLLVSNHLLLLNHHCILLHHHRIGHHYWLNNNWLRISSRICSASSLSYHSILLHRSERTDGCSSNLLPGLLKLLNLFLISTCFGLFNLNVQKSLITLLHSKRVFFIIIRWECKCNIFVCRIIFFCHLLSHAVKDTSNWKYKAANCQP